MPMDPEWWERWTIRFERPRPARSFAQSMVARSGPTSGATARAPGGSAFGLAPRPARLPDRGGEEVPPVTSAAGPTAQEQDRPGPVLQVGVARPAGPAGGRGGALVRRHVRRGAPRAFARIAHGRL